MTQEEKQLLLKDLCARLPYRVKCCFISSKGDIPSTIVKVDIENETVSHIPDGQTLTYFNWIESGYIKPYLRPMSSMTEKEFKEYHSMLIDVDNSGLMNQGLITKIVDWLDEKMFDHRYLIPMGLALEVPEEMYK